MAGSLNAWVWILPDGQLNEDSLFIDALNFNVLYAQLSANSMRAPSGPDFARRRRNSKGMERRYYCWPVEIIQIGSDTAGNKDALPFQKKD